MRELAKPERIAAIKARHGEAEKRRMARHKNRPLVETLGDLAPEDAPHLRDGCLICSI
ncbi:hypothetical protein [uncultured Methylobacterium sp.]|uniref:hypothetical protein n=1 Tax=uncultured Methylobacterium sp. TaxID=157278 RepID=UPI0035C9C5A9